MNNITTGGVIPSPHAHPDFVNIQSEWINRHKVLCISLEEWEGDEPVDFPFRFTITLQGGIEKIFEIDSKEYASELLQKFNGSWHPPIPTKEETDNENSKH
tara:strand:+ start:292 stop:594 length:303 start_codon:yes stop_codon:yes gene_type:complete